MSLLPQHHEKVLRCLALLEHAQSVVNRAAEELYAVPGFADQWSALSEPHDVIKRHWYSVERRLSSCLYPVASVEPPIAGTSAAAERRAE